MNPILLFIGLYYWPIFLHTKVQILQVDVITTFKKKYIDGTGKRIVNEDMMTMLTVPINNNNGDNDDDIKLFLFLYGIRWNHGKHKNKWLSKDWENYKSWVVE